MKALIPILAATAALTITGTATEANAHPATDHRRVEVTSGSFETLPGGTELGYDVRGHAVMIRSTRHGGRTTVAVCVRGLQPETVYPTHVHDQPCSSTPPGGSHYQHEVGGPVDAANEMWPTVTTNRRGNGFGVATHGHRARADAQSIVVHFPLDTSIRLACLDLT